MMVLQKRQILSALLVLALYSPVYLSVSVPGISRLWSGYGYMIFIAVMMIVFVALAWLMVGIDSVDRDGGDRP